MSLDHIVYEAVTKAVEESEQNESLSTKIIAWIDALASGNENQDDIDSASRRARLLFEDTELPNDSEAK